MNILINVWHAIVFATIILVCWVGSAQLWIYLFGEGKEVIIVAVVGMMVGSFLAVGYLIKFTTGTQR